MRWMIAKQINDLPLAEVSAGVNAGHRKFSSDAFQFKCAAGVCELAGLWP